MRFSVSLALLTVPALAHAEDGGKTELPAAPTRNTPVIGGSAAPAGKWPDAVAVEYGGSQACSGTLIAPTVVITAGHCVAGGAPDSVLIGASALSRASEGERITVIKAIEYPNSQSSMDVGVLVLAKPSQFMPRQIATGWARSDIKNAAAVEFVGFGTTDKNGTISTDNLMEAQSTITDYNCTTSSGCNTAAKPDGELGAGGMGIDTCPGDSGGPMYLLTDYGSFLAGVTSRAYDTATYACSEGGIYERPDKIVDWITQQTSAEIAVAPGPTAELVTTVRGDAGESQITHHDPKSDKHTYAVTTQPQYGKAAVSASGVFRVCANKDVVGGDTAVVTVTDQSDPTRKADVKIAIKITDGDPPSDCDPTDFGDTGGCCDARRSSGGSIPLALFVGALLLRRRRSR
ncbi:MAG TPA: trypsin-like serine protease [Kofleriaceae bacterium]|nr:trypsin-like serine protease [Kofleriaceae bacterium]